MVSALALTLLLASSASAIPAQRKIVTGIQPDGSTFSAITYGDEFARFVTTLDGCSLTKDKDGWWCYAAYDSEGKKHSSGVRLGDYCPAMVKASSMMIPYDLISERAAARRKEFADSDGGRENLARRLGISKVATKAETPIKKHAIILLAEFKDVPFTYSNEDFTRLLTENGYNRNGATGCAVDYLDDQFGKGNMEWDFDIVGPVTLPQSAAYYGGNDENDDDLRPEQMVIDACKIADSTFGVDFSLYDDDEDGYVDNIFVFYSGKAEPDDEVNNADCIWPHAWYIYSGARKDIRLDGVRLDRYACASELDLRYDGKYHFAAIGTFCHEYMHTFGLMDMYDTDYGNPRSAGLWTKTSLMDGGNYNNNSNTPPYLNAIERECLGLAEPETLAPGKHTLEPVNKASMYYKYEGENKDEYYLFECRSNEGWDKYIAGKGMLIYHVDKSDNSVTRGKTARDTWYENLVNAYTSHQCADLVEASGKSDSWAMDYYAPDSELSKVFFPEGAKAFGNETTPAFMFWNGSYAELGISDIKLNGSNVVFNVYDIGSTIKPPKVASVDVVTFQNAAIVTWTADKDWEDDAYINWGKGENMEVMTVKNIGDNTYVAVLEGLSPRLAYKAEVYFVSEDLESEREACNFTTKSYTAGSLPFIYLKDTERNEDKTFPEGIRIPLRVQNAPEAEDVSWSYGGHAISIAADGYYYPSSSGVLKAVITNKDGSKETIIKKINIKKQ